jgi:hypothetical protein
MLSRACFLALLSVPNITSAPIISHPRCDMESLNDYRSCVGLLERCVDTFTLEPTEQSVHYASSAPYDELGDRLYVMSASAFCRDRALAGTAQFIIYENGDNFASGLRNNYCTPDDDEFICQIPCDGETHVFYKNNDVGSFITLTNNGGENDEDIRFSFSTRGNQFCVSSVNSIVG